MDDGGIKIIFEGDKEISTINFAETIGSFLAASMASHFEICVDLNSDSSVQRIYRKQIAFGIAGELRSLSKIEGPLNSK